MKKDNRGLSLIEMIVVITIMAVMVGGVALGVGLLSRKSVDRCADRLRQLMQNNRASTMGRYDSKLEIYEDGNNIYVLEYTKKDASSAFAAGTPVEIGVADIQIKFTLSDGHEYVLGDPGSPSKLILRYDRSSGAMKPLPAEMGTACEGKYCTKIEISRGTKVKTISISYLTGKMEVE